MTKQSEYFSEVKRIIDAVIETQQEAVSRAAECLTRAIVDGHTIWAFGCTHSEILTAELFYRAGGLILINPIVPPGMWINEIPITKTSRLEKLSGIAEVLLDEHKVKQDDVIIIASTSGRNAVPVEMALGAKKRGVKVIAVTSVEYSQSEAPKNPTGNRLMDFADIVLDNRAPAGDAVVPVGQEGIRVGPVSTITGALLLNAVVVQTAANLAELGMEVPVFLSANKSGGQEHNERLLKKYAKMIRYQI